MNGIQPLRTQRLNALRIRNKFQGTILCDSEIGCKENI